MQVFDGSFAVSVEQTPWGDVSLTLSRADPRIQLDPTETVRVCREVWALVGRSQLESGPRTTRAVGW